LGKFYIDPVKLEELLLHGDRAGQLGGGRPRKTEPQGLGVAKGRDAGGDDARRERKAPCQLPGERKNILRRHGSNLAPPSQIRLGRF
jgi:hypothetical protein